MMMTNYMELLATNSPWNLIFFMVIPVVLAEAMVAAEFYILYKKEEGSEKWQKISRVLGIVAGIYFTVVVAYLSIAVLPYIQWRGIIDVAAIAFYVLGVVPLGAIALLELGVIGKALSAADRMRRHFQLLIGFLVVSHVAMVFGMVNPSLGGWHGSPHNMPMNHRGTYMHHMNPEEMNRMNPGYMQQVDPRYMQEMGGMHREQMNRGQGQRMNPGEMPRMNPNQMPPMNQEQMMQQMHQGQMVQNGGANNPPTGNGIPQQSAPVNANQQNESQQ